MRTHSPNRKRDLIALMTWLAVGLAPVLSMASPSGPMAVTGVLDLSGWDFERDGPVDLRGEWRFKWQAQGSFSHPPATIQVPSSWRGLPNPHDPTQRLGGHGYGILELDVILPSSREVREGLGLFLRDAGSAYEIRVRDHAKSHSVISSGQVASQSTQEIASWVSHTDRLFLTSQRLTVEWHISNHSHFKGGPWYAPRLGIQRELSYSLWSRRLLDMGLTAILFLLALYHFALAYERPSDKIALWFGITCLTMCARQLTTSKIAVLLAANETQLLFEITARVEYITIYLLPGAFAMFISKLVPAPWWSKFTLATCIIGLLYTLMALTQTINTISSAMSSYQILLVLMCVGCLGHLAHQALRGVFAAKMSLTGFLPLLITSLADILSHRGIIDTEYMSAYGFGIFIIIQSYILVRIFSNAYKRAEQLGNRLQHEVEARTKELQHQADAAQRATHQALQQKAETELARHLAEEEHSEAERLRQEAVTHAQQLQDLDEQKTLFFQNISHELRTPLTLILSPLDHQESQHPDNDDIRIAAKNARRLLRLVNQLLDFQKLSVDKRAFHLQDINLVKFANHAAGYVVSSCQKKEVDFRVRIEDMDSAFIHGEIDALEKITFNFLSNALKHTPRGGSIELGVRRNQDMFELAVSDSGTGISQADQGNLFQIFEQLDNTTSRTHQGSGLGLALAKKLTEEMGGQIGVESKLGEGSTFWVRFKALADRETRDVLIRCDDDAIQNQLLDSLQSHHGIESVELARSHIEAEALLARYRFGAVIEHEPSERELSLSLLEFARDKHRHASRLVITENPNSAHMGIQIEQGLVHRTLNLPSIESDFAGQVATCLHLESSDTLSEISVQPWLLSDIEESNPLDTISPDLHESDYQGRVLVVDDLYDMRQLIGSIMQRQGYSIVYAADGENGLEVARRERPDLIITDWMMPKLSGPDMISQLKREPDLTAIPVILLTARSDDASRIAAGAIGADAFLGKPFDDKELTSITRNLISLRLAERQLGHATRQQSMTQLAAQISHELNNPLNYISASGSFMRDHLVDLTDSIMSLFQGAGPDAEPVKRSLSRKLSALNELMTTIESGVERSAQVVQKLRGVTELDGRIQKQINLRALLESATRDAHEANDSAGKLHHHIEVSSDVVVEGNPFVLRQVTDDTLRWVYEKIHGLADSKVLIAFEHGAATTGRLLFHHDGQVSEEDFESFRDGVVHSAADAAVTSLQRLRVTSQLWQEHGGTLTLNDSENGHTIVIEIPYERPVT